MTVEKRFVLVGIRIDSHSRQLLNWALVKVAEPGDCVIALHVVKSQGNQVNDILHILAYCKFCFFPLIHVVRKVTLMQIMFPKIRP